jgi:hypothetical protein
MNMQLTKSQKLMVSDGCPVGLFLSSAARAKAWADCPPKPMGTFIDLEDSARKELRAQITREATERRIAKMLAGQARKAVTIKPRDIRGMRWDARRNKFVPINPLEPRTMKTIDDTKPATDEQAPPVTGTDSSVADNSKDTTTMTKTPKKTTAKKSAKKSAKKAVAKKTSAKKTSAAKSDKPKGPGVIATIVSTINRASGASAEEILAILTAKFPDREPDGMMKTIRIQANKNAHHKDKTEKRGLIYYGSK